MTGFVYAIECGDAVKIGWGSNPVRRLSELNVGSARVHRLVGFAHGTKDHEAELHQLCAPHRIRGEWFRKEGVVALFLKHLPARPAVADRPPKPLPLPKSQSTQVAALCAFMIEHGLSTDDMVDAIGGCSLSGFNKWKDGSRVPRPRFMARILEVTRGAVTANDFFPSNKVAAE